MILVTDIHYFENKANAAGLLFTDWTSEEVHQQHVITLEDIAPYESGQFYKRELPCILKLLKEIDLTQLEAVIVDGYVTLGAEQSDGLGMYLYRELESKLPVIGVAKNVFQGTPESAKLYRGESQKALFVTSVGIELDDAKKKIGQMHGEFRLPTLLKRVDQICREV